MSEHDLGQELDRLLTLHREATGEEKAELLEQMIGLFGGIAQLREELKCQAADLARRKKKIELDAEQLRDELLLLDAQERQEGESRSSRQPLDGDGGPAAEEP